MNKARRKELEKVAQQLEEIQEYLEELKEQEETAYGNLPKSIQYSERGDTMSECIYEMYTVCSDIEDVISNIYDITSTY